MYRTILEYIREIRITQTLLGQTFLSKKAGCFALYFAPKEVGGCNLPSLEDSFQWGRRWESRKALPNDTGLESPI